MATKREYLVERGLAKPSRGRFSKEAVAALAEAEANGVVFDEPVKPEKSAKPETDEEPASGRPSLTTERTQTRAQAPAVKPWRIMREYSLINGTDPDGNLVQFGDCQRCAKRVRYCECADGPVAPAGLTDLTPVL